MSVFSNIPDHKILYKGHHFFLIYDSYPVSPGHILIISNKEKVDYFALNKEEQKELTSLVEIAKDIIEEGKEPDGYNIGMNCGEAAGQTVMHFHCHVIPRYRGDMDNPRGGIRHCIRGKGYY
ncbi:HIT family protein [Zeaxanthinibacter enoshimensis]|uniref:Diadenosine tetraphosphate (Ap4A) HIT family hydrolase n=1 Tax=Zeaxanthinibacter enoshimensis TaxID=392009 RepID=A0A4R6TS32_9FLAO|nr:HIT family protein [Zeaxanthinibacter enoshimensis]TDQ33386.1 diadenosine tetraphosphate (Ap4A) HIT family hydrolase [Zeaxanthinibacter enoshimensis]